MSPAVEVKSHVLGRWRAEEEEARGSKSFSQFERVSSGFTVMAFLTNSNVEYPGSFTLSCSPERIGA
jgi:hypothetical protein